jgi:hypothetical protein
MRRFREIVDPQNDLESMNATPPFAGVRLRGSMRTGLVQPQVRRRARTGMPRRVDVTRNDGDPGVALEGRQVSRLFDSRLRACQ